jgi:hypothetical protein
MCTSGAPYTTSSAPSTRSGATIFAHNTPITRKLTQEKKNLVVEILLTPRFAPLQTRGLRASLLHQAGVQSFDSRDSFA